MQSKVHSVLERKILSRSDSVLLAMQAFAMSMTWFWPFWKCSSTMLECCMWTLTSTTAMALRKPSISRTGQQSHASCRT